MTATDLATVNADALIEGRTADMSAITAEIQATFPAALSTFVERLQAACDAYFDHAGYTHSRPVYEVDATFRGRRFVRIVRRNLDPQVAGDRSVVCFVEIGTGLIYKAATFKAPAHNFTRGCVFALGDMLRHSGTGAPAAILPSF